MIIRQFAILAAASAVLSPAVSDASPERNALNACAHAFASSLASPGAAAPAFKLVYGVPPAVGSVTEYFAREYTFELSANDPKTRLPVARASCSTDSHGGVIALSPVPLDAVHTRLAGTY